MIKLSLPRPGRRTFLRSLAGAGIAAPLASSYAEASRSLAENADARSLVARRVWTTAEDFGPVMDFMSSYWTEAALDPDAIDMTFGNPQELPLPGFVDALKRHATPEHEHWFAYKMNEPDARNAIRTAMRERRGIDFGEEDIFLTNGATVGLLTSILSVVEPGDEVIYMRPPWFGYTSMIHHAGATAVGVDTRPHPDFDLDLDRIADSITPRTKAIIVNSPHNPTGKVFPPETLQKLGRLLTEASDRIGHPIFLISDEAYSRIVLDRRTYRSPTEFYPYSFLVYTFTKTLLAPGQRVGYLVLPPEFPEKQTFRSALPMVQIALTGYSFPNAVLQYAMADLEKLAIDVETIERRRDLYVEALSRMGYEIHSPEGTFYLFLRAPIEDDVRFCKMVGESKVLVLPGSTTEKPGYFRITLTPADDVVERALPAFEKAMRLARNV